MILSSLILIRSLPHGIPKYILHPRKPNGPNIDPGAMGGIIAVSYEARAKGVMRQMSGHEAMKARGRWEDGKIDAPKYPRNTNTNIQ